MNVSVEWYTPEEHMPDWNENVLIVVGRDAPYKKYWTEAVYFDGWGFSAPGGIVEVKRVEVWGRVTINE